MKRAYSVHEVATLLGSSTDATRVLVGAVLGEERDVLTVEELARLRAAGGDKRPGGELGHGAQMKATPAQESFDFSPRSRSPGRDAETLFAEALELETRDASLALDGYAEALAANPRHADAHVNRGRLLHQLGHLHEAEAHYAAALVSRPTDTTATFNLAVVLEDLGRVDDAIRRYNQVIELDGACVDAHFNLARLHELKGEKMAAIRHLKDYRRLVGRRS